jgi:hypothetical protein
MSEANQEDTVQVSVLWTEEVQYAKTLQMTRASFNKLEGALEHMHRGSQYEEFLNSLGCIGAGDWVDSSVESVVGFDILVPTEDPVEETSSDSEEK